MEVPKTPTHGKIHHTRTGLAMGLLTLLWGVVSCKQDFGDTAVILEVRGTDNPPATAFLDWLGPRDTGPIFLRREVSLSKNVDGERDLLARLVIENEAPEPGVRRAVLRGPDGDGSWGYANAEMKPGRWSSYTLTLVREEIPDRDEDGVPDPVDLCDGLPDLSRCQEVDAGMVPDASPDGTPAGDGVDGSL
jgi:hypothetical protein